MNYGKKNAAKIKWQLTSRGTVMRRKVKSLTLLIILLCFVLVLGYGGYRGYQYVEQIIAEAPDINEIDATPSGYMSTVLDAKGNVTAQLVGTGSNRVYVTLRNFRKLLWQLKMNGFTITMALICGGLSGQGSKE